MNRICALLTAVLVLLVLPSVAMAQGYYNRPYGVSSANAKGFAASRAQDVFGNPYYGDTNISVAGFRLAEEMEDGLLHQGYAGEIFLDFYPRITHNQQRSDPHPLSVAFFLGLRVIPPRFDSGVADLISVGSELTAGMKLYAINTPEWLFSLGGQVELKRKDPHDSNPKWGIESQCFFGFGELGYAIKNISLHLRGEYFIGLQLNDRKREGFFSQFSVGWHPISQFDLYLRVSREKDSSRNFSSVVYQFVRTMHKLELSVVMHATKNIAFSIDGYLLFESHEEVTGRDLSGWMMRVGILIAIN